MIKKYKEFLEEGILRHYNRWHSGEKRKQDQHEYVDLGLPSGLLWAKCNLGADTEVDYGGYYAWGETEEKDEYSWDNYKFGEKNNLTKYNIKDGLTTLESKDDAVHMNWGGKWRMPTAEEYDELIEHTTSEWVKDYNKSGVNGRLFTSKKNGNTLFFPTAGYKYGSFDRSRDYWIYVWSISLNEDHPLYAYHFNTSMNNTYTYYDFRCSGFSVRGVINK